jgi:hypothetical protein
VNFVNATHRKLASSSGVLCFVRVFIVAFSRYAVWCPARNPSQDLRLREPATVFRNLLTWGKHFQMVTSSSALLPFLLKTKPCKNATVHILLLFFLDLTQRLHKVQFHWKDSPPLRNPATGLRKGG